MPTIHKTRAAAAMGTNRITSLRELLHYRKILQRFKCGSNPYLPAHCIFLKLAEEVYFNMLTDRIPP